MTKTEKQTEVFKPKTKTVYDDIYVKVIPDVWLHPNDLDYINTLCKTIMSDIERHVNNIAPHGITLEIEMHEACKHCGLLYELYPDNDMLACCQQAIDDYNNWKGESDATI